VCFPSQHARRDVAARSYVGGKDAAIVIGVSTSRGSWSCHLLSQLEARNLPPFWLSLTDEVAYGWFGLPLQLHVHAEELPCAKHLDRHFAGPVHRMAMSPILSRLE
jgi:hypothetical protein